jgi:hypothetical protein
MSYPFVSQPFDLQIAIAAYEEYQQDVAEINAEITACAEAERQRQRAALLRDLVHTELPYEIVNLLTALTYDAEQQCVTAVLDQAWIGQPLTVRFGQSNTGLQMQVAPFGVYGVNDNVAVEYLHLHQRMTDTERRTACIAYLSAIIARVQRRIASDLAAVARRAADEEAAQEAAAALAREIARVRESQWRWPEQRQITLYRWTWCTALPVGDQPAEYDATWSQQDQLDDGWLVPTTGQCAIRLLPSVHLPVAMRYVLRSVADVGAAGLTYTPHATIPGFASRRSATSDDLIVRRDPDAEWMIALDPQPVAWLRTLLDGTL